MRYGTPEYEKTYREGFSSEEKMLAAQKWRRELFAHIEVQHPHLKDREAVWKTWPSLENYR